MLVRKSFGANQFQCLSYCVLAFLRQTINLRLPIVLDDAFKDKNRKNCFDYKNKSHLVILIFNHLLTTGFRC